MTILEIDPCWRARHPLRVIDVPDILDKSQVGIVKTVFDIITVFTLSTVSCIRVGECWPSVRTYWTSFGSAQM